MIGKGLVMNKIDRLLLKEIESTVRQLEGKIETREKRYSMLKDRIREIENILVVLKLAKRAPQILASDRPKIYGTYNTLIDLEEYINAITEFLNADIVTENAVPKHKVLQLRPSIAKGKTKKL